MIDLEVSGINEIRSRFERFPQKFNNVIRKTMQAALLKIWEIVGRLGYPPPPPNSTYRRTGTFGRSIGTSSFGAGQSSKPDIYKVEEFGKVHEATYGTRLKYAPFVIGVKQAWMHVGRWWNIKQVGDKAKRPIEALFRAAANEMARWLDGRGL